MDLTLIGDVGKAGIHFLNSFQIMDTAEYIFLFLLISLFYTDDGGLFRPECPFFASNRIAQPTLP
jgi:hypothetical protein